MTESNEKFAVVFADGGSRGNPGPAGAGAIIREGAGDGTVVAELAEFLGHQTNNVAEYTGLIIGLKGALEHGFSAVEVRMDSELIVKQMKGLYRVKHPGLQPLHREAQQLASKFKKFQIVHVRRELNKDADRLANKAMDSGNGFK